MAAGGGEAGADADGAGEAGAGVDGAGEAGAGVVAEADRNRSLCTLTRPSRAITSTGAAAALAGKAHAKPSSRPNARPLTDPMLHSPAMEHSGRRALLRRAIAVLIVGAAAVGLVGCGSGSNQASKLLSQTFGGRHRVNSGKVAVVLTVDPGMASALKGPITLGLGGPFQDLGPGKLPASVINIALGAMGTTSGVTITSTGESGYVTYLGQSYKLPKSTFQRLESTFAQFGSAPAGSGAGALGRLGIHPQRWLTNPQIVGDEGMNGINTTHIRAGINMGALLTDLNRFLKHATSLVSTGASALPRGISAATVRQIASEVKHPVLDIWTGVADKTLRRLELELTVPVSGQLSALLGRSARIELTMAYADLNQSQLITAPTKLRPYSEFQDQLKVLSTDLAGTLASGGTAGAGGASASGAAAGGSGSGGSGGGAAAAGSSAGGSGPNYQSYTNCIDAAAGNLSKMQQCAPLLNGQ